MKKDRKASKFLICFILNRFEVNWISASLNITDVSKLLILLLLRREWIGTEQKQNSLTIDQSQSR